MLEPETWLALARELALGKSCKADHVCGAGRTLRLEHTIDGYRAWCFRCNDSGWHPHPQPSLAERVARLKENNDTDVQTEADHRPPMPADFDPSGWPLHARVWLYRAGLGDIEIRGNGIYYCPRLDRVILPVIEGDRLAYWQARGFDKGRPKYLNPEYGRDDAIATYGDTGPVVLVEDVLSAIRVGEVARGWAILGTSFADATANRISKAAGSDGCCLWFDNDKAGRAATRKAMGYLQPLGIDPRIIHSERDPKTYSREEIKRFIYEE